MSRALADSFPRFVQWSWLAYPEEARSAFARDSLTGVKALVGDFDGDGSQDVALDGRDTDVYPSGDTHDYPSIVVLLARADSAIGVRVTKGALLSGDTIASARRTWLRLVPKESYRSVLRTAAIGVPDLRSRGELNPNQVYFWSDGKFYQWFDGE